MSRLSKKSEPYHPLDAIPVIPQEVEFGVDGSARVQVRRPLDPPDGWRARLAVWFRFKREVRINLDERGSSFWNLIDGRRPLKEIARKMRRQFGLNSGDSREVTVKFTQLLMRRGLIYLQLPDSVSGKKDRGVSRRIRKEEVPFDA